MPHTKNEKTPQDRNDLDSTDLRSDIVLQKFVMQLRCFAIYYFNYIQSNSYQPNEEEESKCHTKSRKLNTVPPFNSNLLARIFRFSCL